MKFLPPELEVAMDWSESDPQQAAEVLRIAAKYLRSGEKLPLALALFLADAFERAMSKASMVRGSELLINLNLKAMNKRPAANFEYVGSQLQKRIDSEIPRQRALKEVAEKYNIDKKTVQRMHKKYIEFRSWEDQQDASLSEEIHSDYAGRAKNAPNSK